MNKYFPPLVCGFGAAVFTIIPGMKDFACCLIIPAAAVLSILLHQKATNSKTRVDDNISIAFGLLTGLFAALFGTLFDIIITFFTHSNDFIRSIPESRAFLQELNLGSLLDYTMKIFNKISEDIRRNGFSLYYSLLMLISNAVTYVIFGLAGGVIGKILINKRYQK